MKHLLLIVLGLAVFFSCKNDDSGVFDTTISQENISFTPMPGAATMTYKLPDNPNVRYIQVVYSDFKGKKITVRGSYLDHQLYMPGFLEATQDIPVEVSLLDGDGFASSPEVMTFSVLQSAPSEVLENVQVNAYWSGFKVDYDAPENSDGFIHISYLGINEMTQKLDTLFIQTSTIDPGSHTEIFPDFADVESNATTVIITTENTRGDFAGTRVFRDVPAPLSGKLDGAGITLVSGSSYENEGSKSGWKYLFDGDNKGLQYIEALSGASIASLGYAYVSIAAAPLDLVFDLGGNYVLAGTKMYARPYSGALQKTPYVYYPVYMVPNSFTIFASNDYDPATGTGTWVQVDDYYEDRMADYKSWWCAAAHQNSTALKSVDAFQNADPCSVERTFALTNDEYRYVKLRVNEVFRFYANGDYNNTNRVSFQELEIYVKQD